jgi:hypothetical protein
VETRCHYRSEGMKTPPFYGGNVCLEPQTKALSDEPNKYSHEPNKYSHKNGERTGRVQVETALKFASTCPRSFEQSVSDMSH